MEIFKNKCLSKKIILVLIVIISIAINLPNISYADATEAAQGGKLLQPVVDLVLTFGDGIMDVIQKAIMGTGGHITLDLTDAKSWIAWVAVGLGVLAFIVAAVITGGASIGLSAIAATVGATVSVSATAIILFSVAVGLTVGVVAATVMSGEYLPDITVLPTSSISPQEIFEGKILLFDVNFFNPKEVWVRYTDVNGEEINKRISEYDDKDPNSVYNKIEKYYYIGLDGKTEVTTSKQNAALDLSLVISKWYYTIRNIALVIMMLVLVYIGIRMMLSSVAAEKSKYKKMLEDWVISVGLVFMLHYIMVFAVNMNENIIDILEQTTETKQQVTVINLNDEMKKKDKFIEAVEKTENGELGQFLFDANAKPLYDEYGNKNDEAGDAVQFIWYTNLLGSARMSSQIQDGSSEYVGYAIAYLVLVFYTIFFSFTYLKRLLYMAFLTIIAPLVAMTYSIDRIADGKAQAFNMWFKEYIFNLLIQPLHLLLYMVLITMAFDLAGTNIIYSLVAIGFMVPAEKFVRKMFGFEKAQTPGMLGGAAGAALAMDGMQKLSRLAGHGPRGGNKPVGKLDKSTTDNDSKKIRTADSGRGMDALIGNIDGEDTDNNLIQSSYNNDGESTADADSMFDLKDPKEPKSMMEETDLENLADKQLTSDDELTYGQIPLTSEALTDEQRAAFKINNDIDENEDENENKNEDENENKNEDENENKNEDENENKNEDEKPYSKTRRAAFASMALQGMNKVDVNRGIRKAASATFKAGTKITGIAAGTMIGASLGIASGDLGNVKKYSAIGANAGSSVGTFTGNTLVNGTRNIAGGISGTYKNVKTEYQKERYGKNYSQHEKEKQDREFLKDKEARKYFSQQCSEELSKCSNNKERKEKLDSIMREAVEYRKEGVTDNSIIARARKLNKENPVATESKLAAVMATKANNDVKKMKQYEERVAQKVGASKARKIAEKAADLAGIYK